MKYFQKFLTKWRNRKKYPTFLAMPNWLLVFFAVGGFIIAGYFGFVLSQVTPEFLREANQIPLSEWEWQGLFLVVMLSLLSFYTWLFGTIFWRCNNILRERLFT